MNKKIFVILVFALITFLSNFFWESWHAFLLYESHNSFSAEFYLRMITYVSFMDMLLLLAIFAGGMIFWKNWQWFKKMDYKKYLYFIFASILISVIIEFKAVYVFNQWSYNELMPTIFGMGLSPLLQLATVGLLAIWAARQVK